MMSADLSVVASRANNNLTTECVISSDISVVISPIQMVTLLDVISGDISVVISPKLVTLLDVISTMI